MLPDLRWLEYKGGEHAPGRTLTGPMRKMPPLPVKRPSHRSSTAKHVKKCFHIGPNLVVVRPSVRNNALCRAPSDPTFPGS